VNNLSAYNSSVNFMPTGDYCCVKRSLATWVCVLKEVRSVDEVRTVGLGDVNRRD
jgi:hypothetical protein